jgi:hypothetical protein
LARPKRIEAPPPPNGFVASAARLPVITRNTATSAQGWMGQAWASYDTVAELRFIANWVGNVMSRAALVPMRLVGDHYETLTDGPAVDAMTAYFGGPQGQSQMLQATGVNHTISGEVYHLMLAKDDEWHVLSSGCVTQNGKRLTARVGERLIDLTRNDLVYRAWTPHPRNIDLADSPVRSNLGTLEEIQRLNQHIASQLDSRLAGAGVMLMPSEIQFAAPEGVDPQANQADAFMQVLGEAMTESVHNRGSAAAIVPVVVTAPGEYLDKVQLIHFWTPLDEAAIKMRDNAVKRLAFGMDTPPEVLMGTSENHWSAWIVDESTIKSHLEPRLAVVAHAVTTAYLRPSLTGEVPDPENYYVFADTSQIRLRPNRRNEAIELYDRGELSGDALRRETGFAQEDQPDDPEMVMWLWRKIATGSTSPEQTGAALAKLGASLGNVALGDRNAPTGDDRRIDARRQVRDTREPNIDRSVAEKEQRGEAAVAAADVLVMRALERVGNKLNDAKGRADGLGTIMPAKRYLSASGNPDKLLDGCWDFALDALGGWHPQPAAVVSVLDIYVRGLLTARAPHTRAALAAALRQLDEVEVP